MRKLFCFLGTGNYTETVYHYNDFRYTTRFTQEYLYKYYETRRNTPFDLIVVFATEESYKKNGEALKTTFSNVPVEWIFYDESFGSEPWLFFELMDKQILKEDTIVFDVTHGYRSIPLIALASSELSMLLNDNTNVEAVFYGNYKGVNEPSEFVDLTHVLEVQEWSNAVRALKQTGSPRLLNEMDRKQKENHRQQQKASGKNVSVDVMKMFALGNSVDKLTKSIQFCRLHELEKGWELTKTALSKIEPNDSKKAYPYIKIKDQIVIIFKDFDEAETTIDFYSAAIKWCIRYELYQQAITLMLESIVSTICCSLGVSSDSRQNRFAISRMLQYELHPTDSLYENTKKVLEESELTGSDWEIIKDKSNENRKFIENTFKHLNAYRNDFNHAGTSQSTISENRLQQFIMEHSEKVIEFENTIAIIEEEVFK